MTNSNDNVLQGILLMLGFCITAPVIDVAAKLAAATVPVGQITTARFVVQAMVMAPVCLILGYSLRIPKGTLGILALRAVFLILSTYFFVAAVQVMPIGVLLVIQPKFAAFGLIVLYPLGTAVTFALYMLVTRSLGQRMHPIAMQLHTATVAAAMCIPIMLIANGSGITSLDPVMPAGIEWVWLAGVGIAASIAHLMMTYALRLAPTSTLAPLHYLEIVSAVFFGYLIFSDFPDVLTWLGIGIVVASGLYVIHRERITARAIAPLAGHP